MRVFVPVFICVVFFFVDVDVSVIGVIRIVFGFFIGVGIGTCVCCIGIGVIWEAHIVEGGCIVVIVRFIILNDWVLGVYDIGVFGGFGLIDGLFCVLIVVIVVGFCGLVGVYVSVVVCVGEIGGFVVWFWIGVCVGCVYIGVGLVVCVFVCGCVVVVI